VGALGAFVFDDGGQGVQPFLRFLRIRVGLRENGADSGHGLSPHDVQLAMTVRWDRRFVGCGHDHARNRMVSVSKYKTTFRNVQ
jgi:glycine cleavage system aminomethyltransferase T